MLWSYLFICLDILYAILCLYSNVCYKIPIHNKKLDYLAVIYIIIIAHKIRKPFYETLYWNYSSITSVFDTVPK